MRALLALPAAHAVPLHGWLVRAGCMPAEDAPAVAAAAGARPTSVEAAQDCYLYLRPAPEARPGAAQPPEGAASRGGALTVLVCGLTDALAREGERRFWTSLHRLRDALEARPTPSPPYARCSSTVAAPISPQAQRVLPGAGAFEAACAARLEREAAARTPLRGGRGGGATDGGAGGAAGAAHHGTHELLRAEAMLALGAALNSLSLDVLHNAGLVPAAAAARLQASLDGWRPLSAPAARALCQQSTALLWKDAAWSPLLGVDASTASLPPTTRGVYDPIGAKLAALDVSVDTLQLVLLSDAVLTNQPVQPQGRRPG